MTTLHFQEGIDASGCLYRRKQLRLNIIDGMANIRPWTTYAERPRSLSTYEAGQRKITYRAFANAINRVAWLLEKHLGWWYLSTSWQCYGVQVKSLLVVWLH